eukprot:GEMP01073740.1.p1 GENE.GEMP01073740.1~~GEMP01073740.1.p1  ORF type:complete len:204 (+),score=30.81 GEMP01073740.1:23-613(+)
MDSLWAWVNQHCRISDAQLAGTSTIPFDTDRGDEYYGPDLLLVHQKLVDFFDWYGQVEGVGPITVNGDTLNVRLGLAIDSANMNSDRITPPSSPGDTLGMALLSREPEKTEAQQFKLIRSIQTVKPEPGFLSVYEPSMAVEFTDGDTWELFFPSMSMRNDFYFCVESVRLTMEHQMGSEAARYVLTDEWLGDDLND